MKMKFNHCTRLLANVSPLLYFYFFSFKSFYFTLVLTLAVKLVLKCKNYHFKEEI